MNETPLAVMAVVSNVDHPPASGPCVSWRAAMPSAYLVGAKYAYCPSNVAPWKPDLATVAQALGDWNAPASMSYAAIAVKAGPKWTRRPSNSAPMNRLSVGLLNVCVSNTLHDAGEVNVPCVSRRVTSPPVPFVHGAR